MWIETGFNQIQRAPNKSCQPLLFLICISLAFKVWLRAKNSCTESYEQPNYHEIVRQPTGTSCQALHRWHFSDWWDMW